MKIELYIGIMVVFLIAFSAVAAYALNPTASAADAGEESENICTSGTAQAGPCTEEQNCGSTDCAALEGRSCGCAGNVCQI